MWTVVYESTTSMEEVCLVWGEIIVTPQMWPSSRRYLDLWTHSLAVQPRLGNSDSIFNWHPHSQFLPNCQRDSQFGSTIVAWGFFNGG